MPVRSGTVVQVLPVHRSDVSATALGVDGAGEGVPPQAVDPSATAARRPARRRLYDIGRTGFIGVPSSFGDAMIVQASRRVGLSHSKR
jgi:hypothetical protein